MTVDAPKLRPGELVNTVNEYSPDFLRQLNDNRVSIEKKYIEDVTGLLACGADINDKDDTGMTALMWAAKLGFADLARLLIGKGADIEGKDENGQTALIQAARMGRIDVVRLLLAEGAAADERDNAGKTALMCAAEVTHRAEIIRALIGAGANVNKRYGDDGATPLIRAAGYDDGETVRLLLDHGAELDAKAARGRGRTALMSACWKGHEKMVRQLVEAGAALEVTDNNGYTALAMLENVPPVSPVTVRIVEFLREASQIRRHAAVAAKQERLKQHLPRKLHMRPGP